MNTYETHWTTGANLFGYYQGTQTVRAENEKEAKALTKMKVLSKTGLRNVLVDKVQIVRD
ncbi:hypothetical protein [Enterococcus rivorum]|uniref:Uncharacterized protein n=1 Tax=Enterococcus rivorum TaxID=762845 RepID=A0A1E5L0E9_9ENTE|nr:hypothetical protein [Enterococcus rivorum]MBP2098862.1 hypothetical protein [Enterococcus rivorum]OEH83591.1 hypothetical protein BCR26_08925 [Enterococcus rivorum]